MRNLYVETRSNAKIQRQSFTKFWQVITLSVLFAFTASIAMAQSTLTWLGTENTRMDNENNWDPAGSISGNYLVITAQYDTLGNTLYANSPVLTGSTNYSVKEVTVNFDKAFPDLQGGYTIELDNDDVTFTSDNGGTIQYGSSGITINRGTVYFNSYKRFDNVGTYMNVNGGHVIFKRQLFLRDGDKMETGGHINFTGGKISLNDGFHSRVNKTMNQWTITGDAVLDVKGNYGSYEEDIASGWMSGGDDFSVVRSYDPITNRTTYYAVPAASFLIANSDRQVVVAGTPGTELSMIPTVRVTNAQSLTWKYRKQGETTFTTFTDASTTASYTPLFVNSGVYYVICEGVDAAGTTVQSQEVEFFAGSNLIAIDPLFSLQYLRPTESGAKLTATFTGTASSMEWKYSTVPSGPYMSFDTPETTNTYIPSFDSIGNYYVILEATIASVKQTSFELFYVVESPTSSGKKLTWTGLVSDVGTYSANWTPVANTFKNSLYIYAFDSLSTLPYPEYNTSGNDTINYLEIGVGAKCTLAITDSLNVRSDCYINGELNITSGVFTPNASYFRITSEQGVVTLSGDAVVRCRSFIMSDNKGAGGNIYITENSKFYNDVEMPWRQSPDTLESVTYLKDNGQMWYIGDVRTTVQGWVESGKIACVDEGWEPYVLYDAESDYTFVQARNTSGFAIANDQKTYTTANNPTEAPITLANVDGVNGWEWKWSTSVTGPWNSFDPAEENVVDFYPTFAESGTYYIVAETSTGELTSNMKPFVVIDLGITPADDQFIDLGVDGDTLMAVIPAQFTVSAIAWYYRVEGSEEFFETGITDSVYVPNFASNGVYEVFYGVEVQDEFSQQYFLISSAVKVTAGNVGVSEMIMGTLKLYPNPTSGKFSIEGNFSNDYTLEIIDLTGSVVFKQQYAAHSNAAIDFSRKGVYIVKMSSDTNMQIGRLVVN